MTERDPPNRRPMPKTVNLMDVLAGLGHTPESFARLIGRNASGLRRTIRGETKATPSATRDIIEGLRAEGWRGDPNRIVQLRNATQMSHVDRLRERTEGALLPPAPGSRAAVSRALTELMRYLGREEVDRVYAKVFGTKPNEKNR